MTSLNDGSADAVHSGLCFGRSWIWQFEATALLFVTYLELGFGFATRNICEISRVTWEDKAESDSILD